MSCLADVESTCEASSKEGENLRGQDEGGSQASREERTSEYCSRVFFPF